MPRLSVSTNRKLRRHAASGQGIVTLSGRDYYLGPWPDGRKRPPGDVQDAYDCRIAEWRANGRRPLAEPGSVAAGITIGELIVAFTEYARKHYRRPVVVTLESPRCA